MNVQDDLYLGPPSINVTPTAGGNPTRQNGAGPAGRFYIYDIVPATIQTANIAALQAQVQNVALVLAAGAGVTAQAAPDGSGATVYAFDVPRAVSLTSLSNLSATNFTITGYDFLGRKTTQVLAGPNDNTVNTLKSFLSVLSIVPNATNANTVSVGSSDIFGLPWVISDGGYVQDVGWNGQLARDAGTLVTADATNPATSATGDPRGTYKPSANASNGARRLVFGMYLNGGQCGPSATFTNLTGVTPA